MNRFPLSSKLYLGLFVAVALLCITVLEVTFYYPKVKTYFDNTSTKASKNLASRSRQYLLQSLELVSSPSYNEEKKEQVTDRLNMAYGLLNIGFHTQTYFCASDSLNRIDELVLYLSQTDNPDIVSYTRKLLPVIQCTITIQDDLDRQRASLALKMLDDLKYQQQLIITGALSLLFIATVLYGLQYRHKKLITKNKDETHKWIRHAMEDALTGALNRRAFDLAINEYILEKRSFSILMCDIDYFKQYNDVYGHLKGDEALKDVTKAIKALLRKNDNVYRYGGEELVIILNDTNNAEACQIGTIALKLIRELNITHEKSEHGVLTMSVGVATFNDSMKSGEQLIKVADERLYLAKNSGRNCIVDKERAQPDYRRF